jgi:uncharacterized protein YwgA/O-acetyl-ADP-ribose deacetylase (regulator of RNase III)
MKKEVQVIKGDLFASKMQTLTNTVNCVGIMGKGIALEFKKCYPAMFEDYYGRCKRGEVKLGKPFLFVSTVPPWILNFPTKEHWRSISRIEDIENGLNYLIRHYREWGIKSLAMPPLGCGHGQLEWRVIGPTLFRYLSQLEIPVELYAPYGTPDEELQADFLGERTTAMPASTNSIVNGRILPAWVGLVEILKRIEQEPYHWPIGRTTFQKIAYIATLEGIPTGLDYRRGSFGPFSPEVKNVITKLANNGLIKEECLGRMFAVSVGITFDDARKAYSRDILKWKPIIDKVADLFMRMNTKQAELVATVLFVAKDLAREKNVAINESDILKAVMSWKHRRHPQLDIEDVAKTIRSLAILNWITVRADADLSLTEN